MDKYTISDMGLNEQQLLRYDLLQKLGGDIKEAEEAYQYITNHKTPECNNVLKENIKDGIYYVSSDNRLTSTDDENALIKIAHQVIDGIGIVYDNCCLVLALHDTSSESQNLIDKSLINSYDVDNNWCIQSIQDAVAIDSGEQNTTYLREKLDKNILLSSGWYIPSVGEMCHIFVNLKKINKALYIAGGGIISCSKYWTSTIRSLSLMWNIDMYNGKVDYEDVNCLFNIRLVKKIYLNN